MMCCLTYPFVVANTWGKGWFAQSFTGPGFTDFAGAGIVHVTGGFAALAGTLMVGPRPDRWKNLGPLKRVSSLLDDSFAPHSVPLLLLGTFLTLLGWIGCNCGSTHSMSTAKNGFQAAQAAMNTVLAASAGGIFSLLLRGLISSKLETIAFCGGIRAGLVAITAAAVNVDGRYAIVIGLVGGLLYQLVSMLLKLIKVDDPVDAFAIHGIVGIWGILSAVLFDYGRGSDAFHGMLGFKCLGFEQGLQQNGQCTGDLGMRPFLQNLSFAGIIGLWSFQISLICFALLRLPGLIPSCRDKLKKDLLLVELPAIEGKAEPSVDTEYHYPLKAYIGEGASDWGKLGPFRNPYLYNI
jgi:Amt family ammonium transporter